MGQFQVFVILYQITDRWIHIQMEIDMSEFVVHRHPNHIQCQ